MDRKILRNVANEPEADALSSAPFAPSGLSDTRFGAFVFFELRCIA